MTDIQPGIKLETPFGGYPKGHKCATAYPPYQPDSRHHIVGWISAAHPPKPTKANLPSVEDIEVELSGGSDE